ncbi:hypothetical protein DL98DRAFT_624539 [Cadophora sp. DSE1049]|nr:hypothetical protein DL98DRAFT_624539 [Cadophora sp. DSE1049]
MIVDFTFTYQIQDPDTQQPSFFVLISNKFKSQAFRELFGIKKGKVPAANKCYETIRRTFLRVKGGLSYDTPDGSTNKIYSDLLLLFANVFCFFFTNVSSFRQIARHLAVWLEKAQPSTLPRNTRPKVVIILDIHVVALLPDRRISFKARYRRLKERCLNGLDEVQSSKEDNRTLFFTTHFTALFKYACDYFSQAFKELFDFIKASRKQNLVTKDLVEHIFIFLKRIKSAKELTEFAAPIIVSSILLDNYPPNTYNKLLEFRVIAFEGTGDMILRSGFISRVEDRLQGFFEQSICRSGTFSSSTYFAYLRRRLQYSLPCGYIIYENYIFKIYNCFFCRAEISEEVVIRVYPLTTGVGVLCIDRGGTRGVLPLKFMKRIEDRISSGGLIVIAMFINGWFIDKSTESFEKLAKVAFKRRKVLDIPFLSRIHELLKSYLADGLYLVENIEAVLQAVFGKDKTILDYLHATFISARIGLPVAIICEPSSCIFTNYNGYHVIRPEDGYGKVPLWEIQAVPSLSFKAFTNPRSSARSASAAPGFFPPKKINGNDPLISALSEVAAMFPLVEEPDFMVLLGTGAPRTTGGKLSMSVSGFFSVWKDGAFPRLWRMFWERMRDRYVKQVFRTHPRYHRLDTEFDDEMLRLDNIKSIHKLQLKAQEDNSVSKVIDNITRCAIASRFYFELDSVLEGCNGEYTGVGFILCSIRRGDDAFEFLLDQLSKSSSTFYLNNCPIPGTVGDRSFIGKNGNFRKRVELSLSGRFTITLKQGDSEPCNISGSPYLIEKLIIAQGLNAHFGRADHGKRKRSVDGDLFTRKRQRI